MLLVDNEAMIIGDIEATVMGETDAMVLRDRSHGTARCRSQIQEDTEGMLLRDLTKYSIGRYQKHGTGR